MKKSGGAAKPDGRRDRKSETGMDGSPKKGSHGGKFTWAGDGYSKAEIEMYGEIVDVKDPNFEDPDPNFDGSFKFNNGTTTVFYGGEVIGKAVLPTGVVKARRTIHMNLKVNLLPENIADVEYINNVI